MKNKILNHIDLWLKLVINHLDKHKIQGAIFFFEIGLSVIIWSVVLSIYIGQAFHTFILSTKCN